MEFSLPGKNKKNTFFQENWKEKTLTVKGRKQSSLPGETLTGTQSSRKKGRKNSHQNSLPWKKGGETQIEIQSSRIKEKENSNHNLVFQGNKREKL